MEWKGPVRTPAVLDLCVVDLEMILPMARDETLMMMKAMDAEKMGAERRAHDQLETPKKKTRIDVMASVITALQQCRQI